MHDGGSRSGFAAGYARERDRLLAHLVDRLERDPDVAAVWLEGSLGRGDADDLSDLDIGIVVKDERIAGIVADPGRFVRDLVGTSLEIASPSNAPAGGAFLLTWVAWGDAGLPFQVDWYWYAASTAMRPAAARPLMDRSTIPIPVATLPMLSDEERDAAIADAIRSVLSMIVIAAKRIARGNPWIVASHLRSVDRLRQAAEWLIAHDQRPPYDALRSLERRSPVPNTHEAQATLLRAQLAALRGTIAAAGRKEQFSEAADRAERYLGGVLGPRSPDDDGLSVSSAGSG